MASFSGIGFASIDLGSISNESSSSITGVQTFTIPKQDASKAESFSLLGGQRMFTLNGIYTRGDDVNFPDPEAWVEAMLLRVNGQISDPHEFTWTFALDRHINPQTSTKFWNLKILEFNPNFVAAATDDVSYTLKIVESA